MSSPLARANSPSSVHPYPFIPHPFYSYTTIDRLLSVRFGPQSLIAEAEGGVGFNGTFITLLFSAINIPFQHTLTGAGEIIV